MDTPRSARTASLGLCSLACVALAWGCSDAPLPALRWSATEMRSPAGPDSGQPRVSMSADTVLLSWLERSEPGSRRLLFSRYVDGSWGEPEVVAEREDFLVNVADVPSVVSAADGLWAHWLQRDSEGFGYGVRVTYSSDGVTWTEPWTPHEDGSATDHGFVSFVPLDDAMGIIWLDGRAFASAVPGVEPAQETGLYFRGAEAGAPAGPERPLDARVCDCCPTDAALTADGPIVVYRDRSEDEIRDIRILRRQDDRWVQGPLVHEDGWETGVCPVNGPAAAALGSRLVVAWFTAAGGESRVLAAFSDDSGRTFDAPVRIDDGAPAGRVDALLLDDGSALVVWVERTGGAGSDVRIRRVGPSGRQLETLSLSSISTERVIGFPHLARAGDGAIIVVWTDGAELTPRVRVTRIEVEDS